ncbi:unnamed protein product [Chrysoparadoxa australica]
MGDLEAGELEKARGRERLPSKVTSALQLSFSSVSYTATVSRSAAAMTGSMHGDFRILKDISGIIFGGQLVALIGPSGAGKTSLLDILANRVTNCSAGKSVQGEVRLNGKLMDHDTFTSHCAYVPQEDRLWSALTVTESMVFAAQMYRPEMAAADIDAMVETTITELGLVEAKDTKVGNVLLKGLSGGQKRRLSIGIELMARREVLFLDEPTSGLDAASASQIMALLKKLADSKQMIIVTSIHQPSTQVFQSFDHVMILSQGRTAYMGPAHEAMAYFELLGHSPTALVNPADFLLEVVNADFTNKDKIAQVLDAWALSPQANTIANTIEKTGANTIPLAIQHRGWWDSLSIVSLAKRQLLNYRRDPASYSLRLLLNGFMSIFLGSVYYKIGSDQSDILDRTFLVLWMNAFFSYMNMTALPAFKTEADAVTKEFANGQYPVWQYCASTAAIQIPFVAVSSLLSVTGAYWITGMNDDTGRFLLFAIVMFALLYTVESLAMLLGSLIENGVLALATFASILSQLFIFNGFFISVGSMPPFWIWMYYISPFRYSFEAMIKVVFLGQTLNPCLPNQPCFGATGEEVLETLSSGGGQDLNDTNVGGWIGALFGIAAFLRVVHFFILKSKTVGG